MARNIAGGAVTPATITSTTMRPKSKDHIWKSIGNMMSKNMTSFPKRFNTLPTGVVSNQTMVCRSVVANIALCNAFEDLRK
mmetsp:Transcript_118122/g.286591  ORF Transcript_118122/g.286591 Transcript_118122/m.286591 type:complete len:81 (-) Transcript_118122:2398-2640(-)